MTTNKQMRNLLDSFAANLESFRVNLENDDQRWGFDKAIACFLQASTQPEYTWVWQIDSPLNAFSSISRYRPAEIDRFRDKSGYLNPPSYKLRKNQ